MKCTSYSLIFIVSTIFALIWDILYPICTNSVYSNANFDQLYKSLFIYNDEYFFEKSNEIKNKYLDITQRSLYDRLKFSTNTYDANVLYRDDPVDEIILDDNGQIIKQNATIFMLTRNWELPGVLHSMRSLEDRFNKNYHYDWVFLNDVPFDTQFIESTTAMASGDVYHGVIPTEHWDYPEGNDKTSLNISLSIMEEQGMVYGGSLSYRNMCRFNSGFFFRHELLQKYDYYFRVEPDVEYFCDFPYDPFKVMHDKDYKYGFVISTYEYEETIPSLWEAVEEYIEVYQDEFGIDNNKNMYDFITNKDTSRSWGVSVVSSSDYNLCHFWSNFEIGNLNFFRSEAYLKYFELLDSKMGFYSERWGDAPVHTIAASILLNKEEIIHFDEIGYQHLPFKTCPVSYYLRIKQKCQCDFDDKLNIDIQPNSCLPKYWIHGNGKTFVKE
ncbi:hypothetical protein TPHA_0A02960 [Tetrapisispora phaffii CBS 4417]|uniref:Glycosyltransferase family 15 protein n=1 Tax=Tetrapisispora phaffii (strain ATCC 24235 / CBS 4417 / NBRC 1672 / NRRL Y-8282 / UCD 70-5) TaxID=1071381 RepID=G8BN98_TETPH|nr:hypothetical protein TPHA_0A02960 [Tetrapisispora phaffii CBS 4417]CCE61376.1 hypothetical protein TPHA_0A02960 [Tetrapisispora phaffii CBS 4417]